MHSFSWPTFIASYYSRLLVRARHRKYTYVLCYIRINPQTILSNKIFKFDSMVRFFGRTCINCRLILEYFIFLHFSHKVYLCSPKVIRILIVLFNRLLWRFFHLLLSNILLHFLNMHIQVALLSKSHQFL